MLASANFYGDIMLHSALNKYSSHSVSEIRANKWTVISAATEWTLANMIGGFRTTCPLAITFINHWFPCRYALGLVKQMTCMMNSKDPGFVQNNQGWSLRGPALSPLKGWIHAVYWLVWSKQNNSLSAKQNQLTQTQFQAEWLKWKEETIHADYQAILASFSSLFWFSDLQTLLSSTMFPAAAAAEWKAQINPLYHFTF